jgi:hypothetical protein
MLLAAAVRANNAHPLACMNQHAGILQEDFTAAL